jgi:hypothetical protein
MAISLKPAEGLQVVVAAAGTSVTANPQPYDNTDTVVILNNTAGVDGYVNYQSSNAAMAATGAMIVPGGSSLTLSIGSKSQRPQDGTDLWFDGAAPVTFQITYINGVDG